jgi:hypothetical protein
MHFTPLPYLDPGSGSFLIQLLIASLAGIGVAVYTSWNKIKGWFGIKSKPKEEDDEDDDEPESK